MNHEVSVYDAKSQLSKLITMVERGETVIITKNNKPIVKLLYIGSRKQLVYGLNAGNLPPVGADAFAPLSDEEAKEFYDE